jgi:predicted Zn-dependent peptidase
VSGVGAYQDRTEYPGLLTVFADPVEGVSIELVEQKILDEINRLCLEPVSDWELQRAKNKLSVDFMTDLESNFALARYLTEFECKCSWRKYFESEQAYLAVTAEDVLRVAKQYLQPANCSVVVLRPTAAKSQS